MNGNIKIYIPPISTSFTIFYFQLKKLEIVGFAQFYLINCAAIQKDLVFELQLSRNSQEKKLKSSKRTLCPFIVMHVLLNATKSCLLLQLHWVTYLVNFHPKQSQKSMSAFIPSLHFLGEMCYYSITIEINPVCVLLYSLLQKHCECTCRQSNNRSQAFRNPKQQLN